MGMVLYKDWSDFSCESRSDWERTRGRNFRFCEETSAGLDLDLLELIPYPAGYLRYYFLSSSEIPFIHLAQLTRGRHSAAGFIGIHSKPTKIHQLHSFFHATFTKSSSTPSARNEPPLSRLLLPSNNHLDSSSITFLPLLLPSNSYLNSSSVIFLPVQCPFPPSPVSFHRLLI